MERTSVEPHLNSPLFLIVLPQKDAIGVKIKVTYDAITGLNAGTPISLKKKPQFYKILTRATEMIKDAEAIGGTFDVVKSLRVGTLLDESARKST